MNDLMIDIASSPVGEMTNIAPSHTQSPSTMQRAQAQKREAWSDANNVTLNPIKSQSGSMYVFIHGFIKRKQELRMKSLEPFSLDCCNFPDETKFSCDAKNLQFSRLPSHLDFDGYCTYVKQNAIPVAWSLQQRKVAFLRFNLFSNSEQRVVARYDFDLVSVFTHPTKAFYGFLPLLSLHTANTTIPTNPVSPTTATEGLKAFTSLGDNTFGWIFIGCKFVESKNAPSVPPDLSLKSQTIWNSVISSSSGTKWGLTSNVLRGPNLRPSDQFLVENNSPPPATISLHIALSELLLTSIDMKYAEEKTVMDTGFVVKIRSMDHRNSCEIIGQCFPASKAVQWDNEDAALNVINVEDLCVILEVMVYKSINKSLTNLALLGECKVKLPIEEIQHGLPVNLSLPLRDSIGIRSATLDLSIHASNLLNNANTAASATAVGMNNTGNNSAMAESYSKYLKIECLEGNISLSEIHNYNFKSIYFECRLVFQNNAVESLKDWISQTGYVNLFTMSTEPQSSTVNNGTTIEGVWNAICRITLPQDVYPLLQNASNLEFVSLLIECKDASHMKALTIGRAKVSLPIGIFRNVSKGFEQWVTLTKAITRDASQMGIMETHSTNVTNGGFSNNNPIGRVHLRLSFQQLLEKGFPSLESNQQGIGVFSCLINGVNTSKSPPGVFENTISTAIVSNSIIVKRHDSAGNSDDYEENYDTVKVDEKICYPLTYQSPSLAMFTSTQSILACNTPIYCGNSELVFKVRMDTSLNGFEAKLPLMKVVPKVLETSAPLSIPSVILSLSKQTNYKKQDNRPNVTIGTGKIDPKLSLSSCFIPYVEGKLLIQTDKIVSMDPLQQSNSNSSAFVIRYSMGQQTPKFAFAAIGDPESVSRQNENSVQPSQVGSTLSKKSKSGINRKSRASNGKGNNSIAPNSPAPHPPSRMNSAKKSSPPTLAEIKIHTRDLLLELDETLLAPPKSSDPASDNEQLLSQKKQLQVLLPLILHVSKSSEDVDPQGIVIDEDNDDKLLIGLCYTAPLYIDALRRASTEGVTKEDDDEPSGQPRNTSKNIVWQNVSVELFERRTRRLVAIAHIRLGFIIDHIPHYVSESVQKLFYGNQQQSSSTPELARLELGLKQAFALADADNSHYVSSGELMKVIQDRLETNDNDLNNGTKPKKKMKKDGNNGSTVTLGLDNPGKLLFTLARKASAASFATTITSAPNTRSRDEQGFFAPGSTDEYDPEEAALKDPAKLTAMVQALFRRLDVDGDGVVSWWEWKSVLTALLCNSDDSLPGSESSNPASQEILKIDPIDPLLISFFAVSDILRCKDNLHRFSEERNITQLPTQLASQDRGLVKQSNYFDGGSIVSDQSFNFSLSNPYASKYSKKLTSMIKSLRQSNSLLTKRLEEAAIANQLGSPSSPVVVSSPDRMMEQRLQQQIDRLQQQSLDYYSQLAEARQQNEALQQQISQDKNNTDVYASLQQQDYTLLSNLQRSLTQEFQTIEQNRLQRKLHKEKQMNALLTIYQFFHWKVFPYYRRKQMKRAKSKIGFACGDYFRHKRYHQSKQKKVKAAQTIQRIYRGHRGRSQLQQRQKGVTVLQNKYRQWKAKDVVEKKREVTALKRLVKTKLLSRAIYKLWKGYKQRQRLREAKARSLIFWKIFSFIHWKKFQKHKQRKQADGLLYLRKNQAAAIIQSGKKKADQQQRLKAVRKAIMLMKTFHEQRSQVYLMKYKPVIDTTLVDCLWMINKSEFTLHPDRHGVANSDGKEFIYSEPSSHQPPATSPKPKPRHSKFIIDDIIDARYKRQQKWYPGVIKTVTLSNQPDQLPSYGILYEDGDYENDVPEELIRFREERPVSVKITETKPEALPIHEYQVNDIVEAYFEDFDQWYRGKIAEITTKNSKRSYYIIYDDGDEEVAVLPERMRYFQKYSGDFNFKFSVDDRITARYHAGNDWFDGKVVACHRDEDFGPVYDLAYDDGDYEERVKEYNIRKLGAESEPEQESETKQQDTLSESIREETQKESSPLVLSRQQSIALDPLPEVGNEIVETPVPSLLEPSKMSLLTNKAIRQHNDDNTLLASSQHAYLEELSFFGKVISLNQALRLMEVKFLVNLPTNNFGSLIDELMNNDDFDPDHPLGSNTNARFPHFVVQMIPFDQPNVIWYSTVPSELTPREPEPEPIPEPFIPEPVYLTPLLSDTESEEEQPIYRNVPSDGFVPAFKDVMGYQYYYITYSTDGVELHSDFGKVVRINEKEKKIGVDFRNQDGNIQQVDDEDSEKEDEAPSPTREEKERESKLKDEVKSPETHSSFYRRRIREARKKPKEDIAGLTWINYDHPYMCWYNNEKIMLRPRRMKKGIAEKEDMDLDEPISTKKNGSSPSKGKKESPLKKKGSEKAKGKEEKTGNEGSNTPIRGKNGVVKDKDTDQEGIGLSNMFSSP